jgi:beta-glucosidase
VAKASDYVIFIGGLNKKENQDAEGADRLSLDLPYNQSELISELAKINKNLIVVNYFRKCSSNAMGQ